MVVTYSRQAGGSHQKVYLATIKQRAYQVGAYFQQRSLLIVDVPVLSGGVRIRRSSEIIHAILYRQHP